jgi:hypothetical protein
MKRVFPATTFFRIVSRPCLLVFGLACFAGCAATPKAHENVVSEPPLLLPATLGANREVQQVLRAAYGEHEVVLRCVVHVSREHIEMVVLTALGQRALTVIWDGRDWKIDAAPAVPSQLRPQWLLADMQLALWPLAVLQTAYQPAGWQISESGGGMRLLRHEGKLVAEVNYADTDPWHGRYWISNFRYNYALAIEAESNAPVR